MKKIWIFLFLMASIGCGYLKSAKTSSNYLTSRNQKLVFRGAPFTGSKEAILKIVSEGKSCDCKQPPADEGMVVLETTADNKEPGYSVFVQNKRGYFWNEIGFFPYDEWQAVLSLKRKDNKIEVFLKDKNEIFEVVCYALGRNGLWVKE